MFFLLFFGAHFVMLTLIVCCYRYFGVNYSPVSRSFFIPITCFFFLWRLGVCTSMLLWFLFLFPLFFSDTLCYVCLFLRFDHFFSDRILCLFCYFSFFSLRVRIVWCIGMHGGYLDPPCTPPSLLYDLWHACADPNLVKQFHTTHPCQKLCPGALSVILFAFFWFIIWIYIPMHPSDPIATLLTPSLTLLCLRSHICLLTEQFPATSP